MSTPIIGFFEKKISGREIRRWREGLRMTREHLATMLALTPKTVQSAELEYTQLGNAATKKLWEIIVSDPGPLPPDNIDQARAVLRSSHSMPPGAAEYADAHRADPLGGVPLPTVAALVLEADALVAKADAVAAITGEARSLALEHVIAARLRTGTTAPPPHSA